MSVCLFIIHFFPLEVQLDFLWDDMHKNCMDFFCLGVTQVSSVCTYASLKTFLCSYPFLSPVTSVLCDRHHRHNRTMSLRSFLAVLSSILFMNFWYAVYPQSNPPKSQTNQKDRGVKASCKMAWKRKCWWLYLFFVPY